MKVVIVEDEVLAVEKLERYLLKYSHEIEVVERLDSISNATTFFRSQKKFTSPLEIDSSKYAIVDFSQFF